MCNLLGTSLGIEQLRLQFADGCKNKINQSINQMVAFRFLSTPHTDGRRVLHASSNLPDFQKSCKQATLFIASFLKNHKSTFNVLMDSVNQNIASHHRIDVLHVTACPRIEGGGGQWEGFLSMWKCIDETDRNGSCFASDARL